MRSLAITKKDPSQKKKIRKAMAINLNDFLIKIHQHPTPNTLQVYARWMIQNAQRNMRNEGVLFSCNIIVVNINFHIGERDEDNEGVFLRNLLVVDIDFYYWSVQIR